MKRSIRIAISGSAGIGKSTVCKQVSEHYNIPLIDKGAKYYLKNKTDQGLAFLEKNELQQFQETLVQYKIEEYEKCKNNSFISDRSLVDNLVYAMIHSNHNDNKWMDEYYNTCMNNLKYYTHVFQLGWNKFEIVEDGIRRKNKYHQFVVDSSIRRLNLLGENIHEYIYIDIGDRNPENYFKIIKKSIDNYLLIRI